MSDNSICKHKKMLSDNISTLFKQKKEVLSFWQYMEQVSKRPSILLRNLPLYVRDAILSKGYYHKHGDEASLRRFSAFDLSESNPDPVFGNEFAQNQFFDSLTRFAVQGYSNKTIILHGPNGSAKSSFVKSIFNLLSEYSKSDDGAIYSFSWVFPKKLSVAGDAKSNIGFHSDQLTENSNDYFDLSIDEIGSFLPSPTISNPLILLPKSERIKFIRGLGDFNFKQQIMKHFDRMELSPRCSKIFGQLLSLYHGDILKVLGHIKVERVYLNRHNGQGLVHIGPEMAVDAQCYQITQNLNYTYLPEYLRGISLFDYRGPLFAASFGMIDFCDMFKRSIEHYKYLLGATEDGQFYINGSSVTIDSIFIGSVNEIHLDAFRKFPDYKSFAARFEFIQFPYLKDVRDESDIYVTHLKKSGYELTSKTKNATMLLSKWAVLTRLTPVFISADILQKHPFLAKIKPEEKMKLYSGEKQPGKFSIDERKTLKLLLSQIEKSGREERPYEGEIGASPREILGVILSAFQARPYKDLHPVSVIEALSEWIEQNSHFDFLKIKGDRLGYYNAKYFFRLISRQYLSRLKIQVSSLLGIFDDEVVSDYFSKYINELVRWQKNAKDLNSGLLRRVEDILRKHDESTEDFRSWVFARLANNQKSEVDLNELFKAQLQLLEKHFYEENFEKLEEFCRVFNCYEKFEFELLREDEIAKVKKLIKAMMDKSNASEEYVKEEISYLARAVLSGQKID